MTMETLHETTDLNILTDELRRLIVGRDIPLPRNDNDDLKIKFQYMDERGAINLQRPPKYSYLQEYFERRFKLQLNIYYTTSSKELMIQIRSQPDLEHVVALHERNNKKGRLKLILAKKRDQDQFYIPPQGIYHGVQETALSETSSVFSTGSTSYNHYGNNSRLGEEEYNRIGTPLAPSQWRESRCLGRGSFGTVYVCLNVDTNEQLVVKKIQFGTNLRHRNRRLASLENEVNLLSTLRHPHVVQYHGCAKLQDCFCIFMEFMTGGTLKEQITEMGALNQNFTIDFTAQILSGLAYLHGRNIIHRDIKSANILRHTRALVKIADFGSAMYLQAICSENGVDIHGTPHYTAPEIILNTRRYDQSSDIWSLGICVVEMLTTKTPWHDVDPSAVHIKIGYEALDLKLPPRINANLELAILKMLDKTPESRPSAEALLKMAPFSSIEA
ncbi:unnamed protein product [Bursaphelenchus xylophilus]|uniref:(pine wood nematode) hypothetical protein n=1 Tax=Bursaphelenchus xylophilus TaxID=6326 RepID=A0A1I7SC12_BURXY|nr:unnamed protein product [Bursaphelenchus xylophilus]CAG9086391.1 unnamed protein product [Bursaphelenchus xylophilus]